MDVQYRIDGKLMTVSSNPIKLLDYFERKILTISKATESAVPEVGVDISFIQENISIKGKMYSFTVRVNISKVVS